MGRAEGCIFWHTAARNINFAPKFLQNLGFKKMLFDGKTVTREKDERNETSLKLNKEEVVRRVIWMWVCTRRELYPMLTLLQANVEIRE